MDTVRVCVFDPKMIFKVDKSVGDPRKENLFSGPAASALNEFLVASSGGHPNVTVIQKNSTIDCLEAMKRNESDGVLDVIALGSEDFDIFFPHNIFREVKMTIFSAYNATSPDAMQWVDIPQSSVAGLSGELLILTLTVIYFSFILLNLGTRINYVKHGRKHRHHRLQHFSDIFNCFIQKNWRDFSDSPRRVTLLTLTVASFFILTGVVCVLATELVSLDKPDVISTYKDVIRDSGIKIFIGPHVKKTMSWSGERNGKFIADAEGRFFKAGTGGQLDQILKFAEELFHRRLVVIFPGIANSQIRHIACMVYPITGRFMADRNAFPYYSQDPQGEPVNMVFAITQTYRKTKEGQKVIRTFRRMIEGGTPSQTLNTMEYSDKRAEQFLEKGAYYEKCRQSLIVMPVVPNTQSVKPQNLKSLVTAGVVSGVLIINVFVIEVVVGLLFKWQFFSHLPHLRS